MKNSKININKQSGLFFWIGLNISLLMVITAFEWESKYDTRVMAGHEIVDVMDEIIPITTIEEPKPPKPKVIAPVFITTEEEPDEAQPEVVLDLVDLTDDDIKEIIESTDDYVEEIETVWSGVLESKPEPLNGYKAFYEFIGKNLKYPRRARQVGVEGKVFIQFKIDEFGNITEPKIVRGIGMGCDEEALRVIKMLPPWKPGKQRGKAVRVMMVLPLTFKLRS